LSTRQKLNLARRRVIRLENPFLSPDSRETGQRTLEILHKRLELLDSSPATMANKKR